MVEDAEVNPGGCLSGLRRVISALILGTPSQCNMHAPSWSVTCPRVESAEGLGPPSRNGR